MGIVFVCVCVHCLLWCFHQAILCRFNLSCSQSPYSLHYSLALAPPPVCFSTHSHILFLLHQSNAIQNGRYICEGKRNKSHCFNIQLYSNEIPVSLQMCMHRDFNCAIIILPSLLEEWEKEFDRQKRKEGRPIGTKNCGDPLVSVLCKKETSIEETRVTSDRSQLDDRTVKFLKGFFKFIFE